VEIGPDGKQSNAARKSNAAMLGKNAASKWSLRNALDEPFLATTKSLLVTLLCGKKHRLPPFKPVAQDRERKLLRTES
jgi:hypothetical protein